MFDRIYLFLLLLILKSNLHYSLVAQNIKIDLKKKKFFLNLFFILSIFLMKHLVVDSREKGIYINSFLRKRFYNSSIQRNVELGIFKSNFLNYKSFFKKKNYDDFFFYLYLFLENTEVRLKKDNTFSFKIFFLKKKYISIISSYFYKKSFFKIILFLLNSSFLDFKPYMSYSDKKNNHGNIFNNYVDYCSKKKEYDYILLVDPYVKLKTIYNLKSLNLPIVSIYDDSINSFLFDYPIYLKKIDTYSIYLFFAIYINLFFSGQHLKKKYLNSLFLNFKKHLFLKEFLLKFSSKQKNDFKPV